MPDTRYTKEHEWVRLDGDLATVGISEHAQSQLGDIVFVELPEVGRSVSRGDAMAVVESVKAASDVYAPVGGEVVEANGKLNDDPALVNSGAESDGWFCRIRIADAGEVNQLMDAGAYKAFVESLS
jgi:glycine cleavage system H protein